MGTQTDMKVDRRRRQIAASYRKQGYRVVAPSSAELLPAFLQNCHPDLIAEKGNDHVVIEVKSSGALKGSNDLVELADRVAAAPGWRLELVTVRSDPEYSEMLASDWLTNMLRTPNIEPSYKSIYLTEVLGYLTRAIAWANHIHVRDKTTLHLVRELVYTGVLAQDLLDRVEDALEWQDQLMRRIPQSRSPAEQAAELEKLCRDLHAQAQNPED